MGISILYNPFPMRLFEADGDFASGAKAFFYLARTTTPLSVYTDSPLAVPHPWPVIADAYGLLPPIYLATGTEYKVRIEDALGSLLYAADGIANPLLESAGGGGGAGTSSQLFQTGYFDWQPVLGDRTGWVRANGRTISRAIGTGNTANDDCEALFSFLWNNFSNTLCPVVSGRGANAGADWSASKAIATLDMRGRSAVGLADMGATAAVIELSHTATLTSGSNQMTAITPAPIQGGQQAGVCAGMYVNGTGIPAGTKVASINSSQVVTMSANASASGTGVAVRFSPFEDARVAGAAGGDITHVQTIVEMPSHSHTTQTYHSPVGATPNVTTGGAAKALTDQSGTQATGDSFPFSIWTPSRVGSWFIKK